MAPTGQEEVEYESDPEEVKRSLTMRRREASDDEDDESDGENDEADGGAQKVEIHSHESGGQGGVAEYENEEEGLGVCCDDGDDSYDEEEEFIEEGYREDNGYNREHMVGNDKRMAGRFEDNMVKAVEGDGGNEEEVMNEHTIDHITEEEKKEKEPFSVPTGGAFYMHDDRFQENSGGQHRRMHGVRRLWESKDDRKWGHDKFEEMNSPKKQYETQRLKTSRGQLRGHGRTKGQERGYTRGSSSKTLSDNGNENQFSKVVPRGRGPRRYETSLRNGNQAPSARNKQSWNSFGKKSHIGRVPTASVSPESEACREQKNIVASILNSDSPPFYPSGSSSSLAQKDIQIGMETLHMNESTPPTERNLGNARISSSGSSAVITGKPSRSMSQGKSATASGHLSYQHSLNQVDRTSSPMQLHGASKGRGQSGLQHSAQAFDQHSAVVRQLASSLPETNPSKGPYVSAEMESASETGILVAKGKGNLPPSGSSLLYGGTQVMGPAGSLAVGNGNPNFPAFLPFMPFGGQQGGVPTFAMAFPGYVQPEHGLGNPEMTWLPILTGPGALGTAYCPPYAAIDGSYQAHKPGLPSSAVPSSKDNCTNKPDNEQKPSERPEVTNNGFPQRQNNNPNKQPRRYSEMSFSK